MIKCDQAPVNPKQERNNGVVGSVLLVRPTAFMPGKPHAGWSQQRMPGTRCSLKCKGWTVEAFMNDVGECRQQLGAIWRTVSMSRSRFCWSAFMRINSRPNVSPFVQRIAASSTFIRASS